MAFAQGPTQHGARFRQKRVDLQKPGRQGLFPRKGQQAPSRFGPPHRRAPGRLESLHAALITLLHGFFDELKVTGDNHEQIVELMRYATGQLAQRFEVLGLVKAFFVGFQFLYVDNGLHGTAVTQFLLLDAVPVALPDGLHRPDGIAVVGQALFIPLTLGVKAVRQNAELELGIQPGLEFDAGNKFGCGGAGQITVVIVAKYETVFLVPERNAFRQVFQRKQESVMGDLSFHFRRYVRSGAPVTLEFTLFAEFRRPRQIECFQCALAQVPLDAMTGIAPMIPQRFAVG